VRHYTAAEISAMLKKAGFQEVKAWNEGFPFHDLSKYLANRNPEKTIRQFEVAHYGFYQRLICSGLCFLFHFNVRTRGAQLFAVARKADAEHGK
jgi:tRNA splicing ligase